MGGYARSLGMLMLAAMLTITGCGQANNDNSSFLMLLLGGGGAGDTVVTIAAIPGVTAPAYNGTPVTTITETAQYTGTVSWSPPDDPFGELTDYTATITLTAKSGYTFTGVSADFFTVAGATIVTNDPDSGVVTAEFPATGAAPTVINIAAIPGVTVPAYNGTPVTTITETAQYTGTVSWSPPDDPFGELTDYTATITLTAKSGYTFTGVSADFFTVAGATIVTNDPDSGVVTAVFPETGAAPPDVVTIAAIPGVTVPAYGGTPVTTITETAQYTGTVSWSPADSTFATTTVYTATITLTAKTGYTLAGVSADFFTVAGATIVTNDADSGVVTAVFPATTAASAAESGFGVVTTVGEQGTLTVGSQSVDMIYANNQDSIIFPFSQSLGTPYDNIPATLTRKFFMSETQVTNALMVEVLQWAYNNGKFSTSVGDPNGLDSTTAKHCGQQLLDLDDTYIKINYSSGSFTVDSGYENHPVVCVTWYGAIMFCNWLTEMRDGNTTNVVYAGIYYPWDPAETIERANRNGYRLPSSEEWEYAARYIGTTAPTQGTLSIDYIATGVNGGDSTLTAGYYWTPGDYASGAIRDCTNETATRNVGWYAGDPAMGGDKLMPVAQKTSNQLGFYDMSGNAYDWCFTAWGTGRVIRGGHWTSSASDMQIGHVYNPLPISDLSGGGFRFVRTQ